MCTYFLLSLWKQLIRLLLSLINQTSMISGQCDKFVILIIFMDEKLLIDLDSSFEKKYPYIKIIFPGLNVNSWEPVSDIAILFSSCFTFLFLLPILLFSLLFHSSWISKQQRRVLLWTSLPIFVGYCWLDCSLFPDIVAYLPILASECTESLWSQCTIYVDC